MYGLRHVHKDWVSFSWTRSQSNVRYQLKPSSQQRLCMPLPIDDFTNLLVTEFDPLCV